MGFDRREFRGEIPQFFIDMANNQIRKQQAEQSKAQAANQAEAEQTANELNTTLDQKNTDKEQNSLDEIDIEIRRSNGLPVPEDDDDRPQEQAEFLDKETLRKIGIIK
jgi:hypothetical protein